jgi:5-oxoprolinase (ATP-hydrolysing) subunit A
MDVNVDMGESFGRYVLGNDEGIMQAGATSANIATCFHAGDPNVLLQTVNWAKEYGVAVGAHTGLPDMQGFGRRRMEITPDELYADTIYQIGAIDAVCRVVGVPLQHVKPHGILYRMVCEDELYVETFLQAVADYDSDLWIMSPRSTPIFDRGVSMGLKMAAEALIDLSYDDAGKWVIERVKKARSAQDVAARAVSVATEGRIDTVSGNLIDIEAVTLCCHGDAPNAAEEVKAVVDALKAAGVSVAPLVAERPLQRRN